MKIDKIKIGLYFRSVQFSDFTIEDAVSGKEPLSGTDFPFVLLWSELARKYGAQAAFYSERASLLRPDSPDRKVAGVVDAIGSASDAGCSLFIFSNLGDDLVSAAITACEERQVYFLIWDQNGLGHRTNDRLAQSKYFRRLVTVSRAQASFVRDHPIFSRVSAVYNPLSAIYEGATVRQERDPNLLVYIGALTPSKGFHHLARAWPSIKKRIPSARLQVIGSAKLYNRSAVLGPLGIADSGYELSHIVPYLGNSAEEAANSGVTFLGLKSPREISEIASSALLAIVNPNLSGSIETFCVSAIEMQSLGCFVVGANRGGLRETVQHGVTGHLIDKEDELAEVIVSAMTHTAATAAAGRAGAKWARESFTRENFFSGWDHEITGAVRGEPAEVVPLPQRSPNRLEYAREWIRLARKLPIVGCHLPTLADIRVRRFWR